MHGNVFSGGTIDRAQALRRDPVALKKRLSDPDSRFLLVRDNQSLVEKIADGYVLRAVTVADPEDAIFLGLLDGRAYFALDTQSDGEFADLRQIATLLSPADASLLAYARAILQWRRNHLFCGRCGAPTVAEQGGHVRRCGKCQAEHFPRTDPAVIMLVWSGDHCLLGRQAIWTPGMMSTLAGFVEPGETLEEAVAREVFEETGIRIKQARYHSAQPWPFPGSLMVGFTAEAEDKAHPTVDPHELEAAAWFSRDAMPEVLPGRHSIARRLIEDWLNR
jgi:NAD+ diphosphatase